MSKTNRINHPSFIIIIIIIIIITSHYKLIKATRFIIIITVFVSLLFHYKYAGLVQRPLGGRTGVP
jgi:cobalamin synthase